MATTISNPFNVIVKAGAVGGERPITGWNSRTIQFTNHARFTNPSGYYNAVAGTDVSSYGYPTEMKNYRYAKRAADGKYYFFRADFQDVPGAPRPGPGGVREVHGVVSLDLSQTIPKWEIAYPWKGYAGDVQPTGVDSGNYQWDTTRDCGWLTAGGNPFGDDGSTWASTGGLSTWGPASAGIYKFSNYGGRWHWDLHTPTASVGNIGMVNIVQANAGAYDPVTDSIWCVGISGVFRLALSNMTIYVPSVVMTDAGVPTINAHPNEARPWYGSEIAAPCVIDVATRKLYHLDFRSYGAPFGGNPATPNGRLAGVIWETDISSIGLTGHGSVNTRVFYSLPDRYRRAVYDASELSNSYANYFGMGNGYDNHMEYWVARKLIILPLPPQATAAPGTWVPGTVFVPGETGFTPGTETPSLMISTQTGTAVEGPPFNPNPAYYNTVNRNHSLVMIHESTGRVAMGWKSGFHYSYQLHQAITP